MALEGVVSLCGAVSAGGEVRREGGMVAVALSGGFCLKFQGCYILTAGEKKGLRVVRCYPHLIGHISVAAAGFCAFVIFLFLSFLNASKGFIQAQLIYLCDPLRLSPFLEKGTFSCLP